MSSFSHLKERQPLQKNTVNLRWCCWHLVFKLLHEGYFKTISLLTNYCHYFNFQVIRQQSIILPSTYVHTCFLAQGFHQVLSRWLLQDPKTMKSKNMLKYSMIRAMSQFLYPGGKLSTWWILWEVSRRRWKKKGGAYNDLWKISFPPKKLLQETTTWPA